MGPSVRYHEAAPRTDEAQPNPIVAAIDSLRDEIAQRHVENTSASQEQSLKLDEVIRRVDALHMAFPNGDVDAHRRQHEALIAKNLARTAFYNDLRNDLAKKGLYAVGFAIGVGLYWWFKEHIKTLIQ
jgi:hypothetical protein